MSIDILKIHHLFRDCSEAFLDKLVRDSQIVTFGRRQVIHIAEDVADRFFLIQNGWVKLYRETLDGSEAVIDIINDGSLFGESALFSGDIYPFSAEAAGPVTVLSMNIRILREEVMSNPAFAMKMMGAMARYSRQQDQELEHRTLQNAPQRIGCFLLRLTPQDESGGAVIHLPYDKTLVAARLGMQPETFSRALAKLRKEIAVSVRGSTIEIDSIAELARYSCTACSAEFPCADLPSC